MKEVKENNLKAIHILEQWFKEPDEYGEEFWKEFQEDLQKNRFKLTTILSKNLSSKKS